MDQATERELRKIYQDTRTIAVVGASADDRKPAHSIPAYLQSQGYRLIPVNPRGGTIFGEPARRSLSEIDEPVDVVEVFRPADEAAGVAGEAVRIGARVLWFQPGTGTEEGERIARDGGLNVVRDRCMGVTHQVLGLGPGPD
jgi:predicted CoA-binding protein